MRLKGIVTVRGCLVDPSDRLKKEYPDIMHDGYNSIVFRYPEGVQGTITEVKVNNVLIEDEKSKDELIEMLHKELV